MNILAELQRLKEANEQARRQALLDDPYAFNDAKPYWACQCCDYENHTKSMPAMDRTKWYAQQKPHKCPQCKSEALQPVGW